MPIPEHRPPGPRRPVSVQRQWNLTIHPLCALDGILIVALNGGETVDYYFGATERAAAAAVAADIGGVRAGRDDGAAK